MVKIINYKERQSEGRTFYVLEIQGGVEMIMNQKTGQYYATAKKARITSTFDKATCEMLVGTELNGSIEKTECEPYEYVSKTTGELVKLNHRYVFIPEVLPRVDEYPENKKALLNETSIAKDEIPQFEDAF